MNGGTALAALAVAAAVPLALGVAFLAFRRPGFDCGRLFAAAAAGLMAVVPAAAAQYALSQLAGNSAGVLFRAFALIALTEEGAKFALLRLFRKRWPDAARAVPAGMMASLAFAFFETLVYGAGNPAAVFLRAFTAVPLHAACGAWVGMAAARSVGRPEAAAYAAFAVLVHGTYDLSLFVPGFPLFIPLLIALGGFALSLSTFRSEHNGEF